MDGWTIRGTYSVVVTMGGMGDADGGPAYDAAQLRARVTRPSNVLLLAPALNAWADEVCVDLLTLSSPSRERILWVTFTQSPEDRLDHWRAYAGSQAPVAGGIVAVDSQHRSLDTEPASEVELGDVAIAVEFVSSPGNLTGIGIEVVDFLEEWADADEPIAVCVHSLTPLLQYVDLKQAYKFLHVFTGRITAADAVAHYHMDPTAHDDQTVNTIKSLFDAVVEVGDDGTVTTRG